MLSLSRFQGLLPSKVMSDTVRDYEREPDNSALLVTICEHPRAF